MSFIALPPSRPSIALVLASLSALAALPACGNTVQSTDTGAQKLAVLHGLYARHLVAGRLDAALERARNLLAAVEEAAEPCAFYPAHRALGTTLLYRGELIAAKAHIERAISRYDPQVHASAIFQFHQDMAVTARS